MFKKYVKFSLKFFQRIEKRGRGCFSSYFMKLKSVLLMNRGGKFLNKYLPAKSNIKRKVDHD